MNQRIVITGADGFVGGHLINALKTTTQTDAHIFACRRNSKVDAAKGVTPVNLDITDPVQVTAAIRDIRPTSIVHLAAISSIQDARENKDLTWKINLEGTKQISTALLEFAPKARLIFVSTSEVYGGTFKKNSGSLDETAPLDPTNTYAVTKAAADLFIGQMVREGLNAVRVRPFNHTGTGQTEAFVVPAFAAQIARIEADQQDPVVRVGNLEAHRDFLDVRDVVNAYIKLILHPSLPPGSIFNIASGVPRRIQDILKELCELSTKAIAIENDPSRMRASDTPFAIGDASSARKMLDWKPQISWRVTLTDVLRYWREVT